MRSFPSPVDRSDTATVTLTVSPTGVIVQSESDNEDIVQVVANMIDAAKNSSECAWTTAAARRRT